MNEEGYLDELVRRGEPVTIRLGEGKDILAIPVAQDATTIIVKKPNTCATALIYKRYVSVITPGG